MNQLSQQLKTACRLLTYGIAALATLPALGSSGYLPMLDEAAMDPSVSPCVDFYSYSCGGWMKNTTMPSDKTSYSRSFNSIYDENQKTLREILENYSRGNYALKAKYSKELGSFYRACMNKGELSRETRANLSHDLKFLDGNGRLKFPITYLLARLQRQGVAVLFEIGAQQDMKDSTRVIAGIDQGGMGLPNRDYYFDSSEEKKNIRKEYTTYIAKLLELSGWSKWQSTRMSPHVLKMETLLAEKALSPVDRRDPQKLYHPFQRNQLSKMVSKVLWERFLADLGLSQVADFNIAVPAFFENLEVVLSKTPRPELIAYLRFHYVRTFSNALGGKFEEAHFNFYNKLLRGQKEQAALWKRCVDTTDQNLKDALGEAFVQKTFGSEGKQKTLEILKNIQLAFQKNLESVAWMDEATKKLALEKLHSIENKIGYPDQWTDLAKLKIEGKSHFVHSKSAALFWTAKDLAKIGKPVDRSLWQMTPPTVNAYYNPELNEIVFPAGILQSPFYHSNSSSAANYGAIGMVIGHEITHGFDDQGRQYDARGNLKDWWSPSVSKVFEAKAECVANQYSKYKVADGVPINGKLTLGENIADLGGIKFAYAAMQAAQLANPHTGASAPSASKYTAEQQFFISFAQGWCSMTTPQEQKRRAENDPHAPPYYRVNGVVVNTPEFQKAFQCETDQPMTPSQKCTVW